jgi:hypothetical protein
MRGMSETSVLITGAWHGGWAWRPVAQYGWTRFAKRLGVAPMEAPGSHEACFTEPEGLAATLLKA